MLNKKLMHTSTKKTAIPISIVIGSFIDSGDSLHTGFGLGYPYSWYDMGSIDKHPIWIIDGKEYTLSMLETSESASAIRLNLSTCSLNLSVA